MAVIATVVGQVFKGDDGAFYLHEGSLDCRLGDKVEIDQVGVGRWVSGVKIIKPKNNGPESDQYAEHFDPLGF